MLNKTRKIALLLMAGLAVATLTVSPVGAASRPAPAAARVDLPGVAPNVPWADAPLAILYNQYDNSGTISLSSQDFEAAYNAYDDQLADDFNVPANTKWKVTGVGIQGLYFNGPGPADSFNVAIYQDAGGVPNLSAAVTRPGLAYTLNGTDQFRIKVSPPINIPASPNGRHLWISVQANLDFAGGLGGEFGWTDRVVQNTDPAAWINPGGGFLTPCTANWDDLTTCLGGVNDGPDFVYLLVGTSTP
jgi:hypothetical protein